MLTQMIALSLIRIPQSKNITEAVFKMYKLIGVNCSVVAIAPANAIKVAVHFKISLLMSISPIQASSMLIWKKRPHAPSSRHLTYKSNWIYL